LNNRYEVLKILRKEEKKRRQEKIGDALVSLFSRLAGASDFNFCFIVIACIGDRHGFEQETKAFVYW